MPKPQPGPKRILIASSALDESTWGPVAALLRQEGYEVMVYKADEVVYGKDTVAIEATRHALELTYNGQTIDLRSFDAAWYRRTTLFSYLERNAALQHSLILEVSALQQALWAEVPQRAWLSSPERITYAERKLSQLKLAKQLGFRVPSTLIANTWEPILSRLPRNIVIKASYGKLDSGQNVKIVYTNAFLNDAESLPMEHCPFPGIWQQEITDKAREWRITVVGDTVFCAAIYTDAFAKDDWRKHQNTSGVRFERGEFPLALQKKCRKYLRAFGLRFGAFDFVEDSQGNITFLECNANGQFGWLEDQLNLPISRAIADELEKIANNRD